MQGVLKKLEKEYVVSINTVDENKKEKSEHSPKREAPKVEKYMTLIGQLLNFNSSMSNAGHTVIDNLDTFNDKRKNLQNNKILSNDNQEQKFSITQLKDKNESLETHKKGFFVITDELREEEDDMSLKLKREILVSKLMCDKAIIIDKHMQSDFNDGIMSSVYLTLSNESRKILLDQMPSEYNHDYNLFNSIIGFDKEKLIKNCPVSNEMILHLCEKLVSFEDLQTFESEGLAQSSSQTLGGPILRSADHRTSFGRSMNPINPILDKFVVEDEKNNANAKPYSLHSVEVKNEYQMEISTKPLVEDEEFDIDEYNFFIDFISKNQDHPIKEKIEKILNIINASNKSGKKAALNNKMKNEILRNLKSQYLRQLEQLEQLEEEKRKKLEEEEQIRKKEEEIQRKEEEIIRKRNFKIENPFEETLDSDHNGQRVKANKTYENSIQSPLKNKIIYTNQGWGISDHVNNVKKTPKPHSVLTTSKNIEKGNKQKNSPPREKSKGNLRYKANDKETLNHNKKNTNSNSHIHNRIPSYEVKKQNEKKVVKTGNQRIIYTDKSNHLRNNSSNQVSGQWMEGDNSDSSGEWVERKR